MLDLPICPESKTRSTVNSVPETSHRRVTGEQNKLSARRRNLCQYCMTSHDPDKSPKAAEWTGIGCMSACYVLIPGGCAPVATIANACDRISLQLAQSVLLDVV